MPGAGGHGNIMRILRILKLTDVVATWYPHIDRQSLFENGDEYIIN